MLKTVLKLWKIQYNYNVKMSKTGMLKIIINNDTNSKFNDNKNIQKLYS